MAALSINGPLTHQGQIQDSSKGGRTMTSAQCKPITGVWGGQHPPSRVQGKRGQGWRPP